MVHGLAHVAHVCTHGLRDGLLGEIEHRVHLFVRLVHLESCLVEVSRELVQSDSLKRRLVLASDPLLLFLFDQLFGL